MTPRELIERAYGDGMNLSCDGTNLHFVATLAPPAPDLLASLKANKAAVLSLLRTLPAYDRETEADLVAWLCIQNRETRLRIAKRAERLRHEDDVPFHVADLMAIESERTGENPRLKLRHPEGCA
ncbi:MAG TPA: hypothetical protein PKE55_00780 [Kiritimatiellia bacterium]|nr:hypothetical protein [Kiritimatiellia bacterium]